MRNWMIQARKDAGFTMQESAKKLGISESYYSLIERGERQANMDIALAIKIADVFHISLEYIIESESSSLVK